MSRPAQSESNRLISRLNSTNKALSGKGQGGPIVAGYENDGGATPEFMAKHPRYPSYQYPYEPERDEYMQTRQSIASSASGNMAIIGPQDVNYWMDKRRQGELVRFKQFVEDSIPRGTPWAKDYFERIMPGWYQERIDVINEKMDIVQRFIDITIRGPQSIEDMWLLYQLYQGYIELPANFQELIQGSDNQKLDHNKFASGFFSPTRFTNNTVRVSKRNQKYLANFAIPGIDNKGLNKEATGEESGKGIAGQPGAPDGAHFPYGPTGNFDSMFFRGASRATNLRDSDIGAASP